MFCEPIFFERNRVGRVYTGGKLFSGFFGDAPEDDFLPEEWIASSVVAANKEMRSEREGVSVIEGTDIYFDALLKENPIEMLGSKGKMRILVKVLDSAVRLPAQAHPDKAYSKKYFNSEYGKTESWLILDTRPGARLYFGFRDGVDEKVFAEAIDMSQTDKDAMERLMEYREPQKGEMFLVPAKTVHAIGAGCLILEIQEPTDFTIQPEHWCDEYELNDQEMYIGLTKEQAIECFSFDKSPDSKITPQPILEGNGMKKEKMIGAEHTDCFIVNKINLTGGEYIPAVEDSYGVYIVIEGHGKIIGDGYERAIKKGDYFFLPCAAMGKFSICGNVECVECY
ncbi:MAG: mannose-6-phosphate isomerase [Ruminococcaceae bacterium]|nr:mannose-6-phosphate isomerase [Oscillospiraceae bacterium]